MDSTDSRRLYFSCLFLDEHRVVHGRIKRESADLSTYLAILAGP